MTNTNEVPVSDIDRMSAEEAFEAGQKAMRTNVIKIVEEQASSKREYKIKELADHLGYIERSVNVFKALYPFLVPVFEYCDKNDISINPYLSWADVEITLPWQKELMELLQKVYSEVPEDTESTEEAKEGMFFKEPVDNIEESASFSFKFYTKREWPRESVIFTCSATKVKSTCKLVKTERKREVSATVYDVICEGEKTGEHLKLE